MPRSLLKMTAALLVVAGLLGALVVLVVHARQKGKLSYCRNNLRRLGGMVHSDRLNVLEEPPEQRGRAFWQRYRERTYYNAARKEWLRKGELNPFGCPVLGRAPLDLSPDAMSAGDYARYMSDPSTIDYRGPARLPAPPTGRLVLAADRERNHPSGGHVLLVDLSVEKQDDATGVTADLWPRALETSD